MQKSSVTPIKNYFPFHYLCGRFLSFRAEPTIFLFLLDNFTQGEARILFMEGPGACRTYVNEKSPYHGRNPPR